uniref:Putative secreted protein n=1 Tax=Ixodes ricinus TaxID=34613 RepID=A0A6B0U5V3_IXORI
MAWTMKVAVLCVVVSTIVANKKYKSPLQVFKEPKDIESVKEVIAGKTFGGSGKMNIIIRLFPPARESPIFLWLNLVGAP